MIHFQIIEETLWALSRKMPQRLHLYIRGALLILCLILIISILGKVLPTILSFPLVLRWSLLGIAVLIIGILAIFIWYRFYPIRILTMSSTLLTAVATLIIAFITYKQSLSNEQQAKSSIQMVEEMKIARKAQYAPEVLAWFELSVNAGAYMITTRNLGGGVARTIAVTYGSGGQSRTLTYPALGPGEEVTNRAEVLSTTDNQIQFDVVYLDTFGESIHRRYLQERYDEHNHPESRYAQWRDETLRNQQGTHEQMLSIQQIVNTITDLKNSLKNR